MVAGSEAAAPEAEAAAPKAEAAVFDALSGEPIRAARGAPGIEVSAGAALVSGPALFDPQVNGFAGVDFKSAGLTADAVEHAAAALAAAGCSHFLPTVTTAAVDRMEAQLAALAAARTGRVRDAVPGFHVEGPFLSPVEGFRGAHDPACMRHPDPAVYERLQRAAGGRIVMLTLAPELPGAVELIRRAAADGVTVCAGHSDAGGAELEAAVRAGLRLWTHLGNGCPVRLHRHDNVINRALACPELAASVIPDGIHLPPAALGRLTAGLGPSRLIATTDAMAAAGSPPGIYSLGDKRLEVGADRVVRDVGGTYFAGSSLTPLEGLYNLVRIGGLGMQAAWRAWTWLRDRMFPALDAPRIAVPFPVGHAAGASVEPR